MERQVTGSLRIAFSGLLLGSMMLAGLSAVPKGGESMSPVIERKTCTAPDGVTIVYSAAGAGEPALVFIHGGLAERSFYDGQLQAFAGKHRVIALDLAGHGESGSNRTKWGMPAWGADVQAVVNAELLSRVILFGNSLGGPVAIDAALLLQDRVIGVVGVDTFQRLDYQITPEEAKQRAETFCTDLPAGVHAMLKQLFHPDADPAVVADAERRMQKSPPAAAYAMFMSLAGYDEADAARRLAAPLRAINGDLYPTDVEGVRKIHPDFQVVIMKHTGHYPMLERPKEFNRHVKDVVKELIRGSKSK